MSTVDPSALYQALGLTREPEPKQSGSKLSSEDFMRLMITELTHQDPFKPMENSEMATQMSQFATVTGINDLSKSFAGLSTSLTSDQALQAATLLGREVLVAANDSLVLAGEGIAGQLRLEAPASSVRLRVSDAAGALVREIDLGMHEAGDLSFRWDGLDDNGDFAPAGRYTLTAEATGGGETRSPEVLINAQVESVTIGASGQGPKLNLVGLGTVSINQVAQIH